MDEICDPQSISDNGNVFETESVHSGMILLQNRSPGRISSADLSKTLLGQLQLQTIIHRFTYHVLQQKRHSLKNGFFIEQIMGTHLFGSPCMSAESESRRCLDLDKILMLFANAKAQIS